MERDIRGLRLRDSFSLLNYALIVSGGFGTDHDNLDAVKLATTTNTEGFASATWQKSRDALLLTGSFRLGTRKNGLSAGTFNALDETNHAFSGGISIPVPAFRAFRPRLTINSSLVQRNDPLNSAADIRDLYFLGGVQGETPERTSEYALLFGLNRSELTGQDSARTDFRRAVATARHHLSERFAVLFDGTYTGARTPGNSVTGLQYNRTELLAGAEYEWMPASILSLNGGVITYSDQRTPSNNTRQLIFRVSLSRAF
jgi:hypothetical protein